jgi:hypothetical protein
LKAPEKTTRQVNPRLIAIRELDEEQTNNGARTKLILVKSPFVHPHAADRRRQLDAFQRRRNLVIHRQIV